MLDDDILLKAKDFDSLYFEALNPFKWDAFAQWRYYLILIAHLFFYGLLWCLGSLHVYTQTTFLKVNFSFTIAFTSIFLVQEFRQFCGERARYVSCYNFIDLATYTLAMSIAGQGLHFVSSTARNPLNTSVYSFAVLCSWTQFLLHLRSVRWLRMALLIDSIYRIVALLLGFWIVLIVTTFAFAHALWTQSVTSNQLFGTFDSSTSGNIDEYGTGMNLTYTFLTLAATNILTLMFLVTVAIVLMNVLIALINDSVNKSNIAEEAQLRLQRARIIAHIELYWMLPHERKSSKKFPREICFFASQEKVDKDREHWEEWAKKNNKISDTSQKGASKKSAEEMEDWTDIMPKMEQSLASVGESGNNHVHKTPATNATQSQTLLASIEAKFQELRKLVDDLAAVTNATSTNSSSTSAST
ncbi:hypothetical protein BZG36_02560 [Bifiguratus adelaidae]|uniref:Ion transport domain-containing protein n=1 Tax=Bifiguratus adelaidae TaxID=1938954 RepID=A0A261Y219_9FUNG|nr:hypothetical protein BZG36_02560 [Bifiguratus adelaidae]